VSGKRRRSYRGPVGPGYMPKGGAAAARAVNVEWSASVEPPAVEVPAAPVGAVRGGGPVRVSVRDRLAGRVPWVRVGSAMGAVAFFAEVTRR